MSEEKLTKKEKKELKKMEKEESEEVKKRNLFIRRILIGFASIVFVVGSVYGLTLLANKPSTNSTSVLSSQVSNIKPVSADDITIGNPKAKVTLVEYSDYECPDCRNLHPVINQTLKDYEGKILFVYRFFPLTGVHKNALLSSQAAYAAKNQGRFEEMHNMLFEKQSDWAGKNNAEEIFTSYAKELGLDIKKFEQDLRSEETFKYVKTKENEAIQAKINHTPTLFVNGKELITLRGYQDLKTAIEQELPK